VELAGRKRLRQRLNRTDTIEFAPDFFVVGAAKAGTTAVYQWLRSHPAAFLPIVKEPSYFAYPDISPVPSNGPYDPKYVSEISRDNKSYARLYNGAGQRRTGDISPVYLLDEHAAERIAAARPSARIIIILRDPVERAFSQFMHHVRDGLETSQTFEEALDAEPQRLFEGWSWGHGYATHGHYAAQIERYMAVFPKEQILFLEYQMLQAKPEDCWWRICEHLGLKQQILLKNERVNTTANLPIVSSRPKLTRRFRHPGAVQVVLKKVMPASFRARLRRILEGSGRPVPVLRPETKGSLANRYQGERSRLEELSGLSLAHWIT